MMGPLFSVEVNILSTAKILAENGKFKPRFFRSSRSNCLFINSAASTSLGNDMTVGLSYLQIPFHPRLGSYPI
jgi:hypothetical protein